MMMKKLLYLIAFTAIILLPNNSLFAQFSGGDGTSGNPYQINTVADLNNIRNYLGNGVYFIQTANLDLNVSPYNTGSGWDPIGNDVDGQRFLGNYDGNGFNISGLFINRPTEGEVGLFGCIGQGTATNPVEIQDVELVFIQDIKGARGTGSLVGRVRGNVYTLIENCSVSGSGTVSGNGATGGLVGANNSFQETPGGTDNPTVSQCWANVSVLAVAGGGGDKIGGLVGCNQKGNTLNSYARGSVTVPSTGTFVRIGGLAGCTDLRGTITHSFSTGLVNLNNNTNATLYGGLVGNLGSGGNAGVVTDSYWDTQTSGQSTSAAGTGLTTTEMKQQTSFVGFDFTNIWNIDGSTNDGYPFLRNTAVTTYNNWTGATSNDWNTTGNWDASRLPIASDIVVIPGGLSNYPIITSSDNISVTSKLVDILQGGNITINPLGKFEVIEDLRSETTGLIIESDASGTGSLLHNAESVNATIERYITGNSSLTAKSYHTVSVPLTQNANPVSGLFLGSYLYEFNASNQTWDALGTPTNTPLAINKGYLIYYPNTSTTYSFSGPMNNGEFEAAQMSATSGNHQLVPNPYPSAIDWNATSGWTKTNLYNAIWVWNASTGSWASYVSGTGTNGGSNIIPVGQSFMVQSSASSPALSMNNDVRVHNDQAFLKNTNEYDNLLRINAIATDYSDEIVVRYHDLATDNFDGNFDAVNLYGLGDAPQLYSFSEDSYKLSINSLKTTSDNKTIQLGFEMEVAGEVTLKFSSFETFDPDMSIYLKDLLSASTIDIRSNPEYTFISDPDNDPLRFQLQLVNSTSIGEIDKQAFTAYISGQHLMLNTGKIQRPIEMRLLNISGQLMFSSVLKETVSAITIPSGLPKGVYVVQLITANGSYVRKVTNY